MHTDFEDNHNLNSYQDDSAVSVLFTPPYTNFVDVGSHVARPNY